MQKWIQHALKPPGHSNYTKIITQICGSNNFSSDFGKFPQKISSKKNHFVEHLDYDLEGSSFRASLRELGSSCPSLIRLSYSIYKEI
jgi:hypothetical protein